MAKGEGTQLNKSKPNSEKLRSIYVRSASSSEINNFFVTPLPILPIEDSIACIFFIDIEYSLGFCFKKSAGVHPKAHIKNRSSCRPGAFLHLP